MNEDTYKKNILRILEINGFKIYEEVWGKHITGKNLRIDAIIEDKKLNVFFGIEFKSFDNDESLGYSMKHVKQSIDYSYTYWGNHQRKQLFIFMSPPPVEISDEDYGLVGHLLNQFNVGILDFTRYGLTFILGGNVMHRIWSENEKWTKVGLLRKYDI